LRPSPRERLHIRGHGPQQRLTPASAADSSLQTHGVNPREDEDVRTIPVDSRESEDRVDNPPFMRPAGPGAGPGSKARAWVGDQQRGVDRQRARESKACGDERGIAWASDRCYYASTLSLSSQKVLGSHVYWFVRNFILLR
jgi:hypothetical protein